MESGAERRGRGGQVRHGMAWRNSLPGYPFIRPAPWRSFADFARTFFGTERRNDCNC